MTLKELREQTTSMFREVYRKQEELAKQYAEEHNAHKEGDVVRVGNKYFMIEKVYYTHQQGSIKPPHMTYRGYYCTKDGNRLAKIVSSMSLSQAVVDDLNELGG